MTDEVQSDAAPSSTEPMQAISTGLTAEQAAAQEAMAANLTSGQIPEQVTMTAIPAEDPNAGASAAAASSLGVSVSVTPASTDAGSSQLAVSSPVKPVTFEQRVEERFLQLENYLVKLPLAIAYAFHQGSATAEEMAQRAIHHLFSGE